MAKKKSLADRLAVCSWSLHPKDPADLIAQLKQLGMAKIQLALGAVQSGPAWAEAGKPESRSSPGRR